jgi:SAM-dependent methyltransferase
MEIPLKTSLKCTLCGSSHPFLIECDNDSRVYYACPDCDLIFTDPKFHLSPEEEIARYSEHNNGIEHSGYVEFLNRAIQPVMSYLTKEMTGLDYGCGPTPTLSRLLQREGITCFDYDPLFGFAHPQTQYDFIFATECFEHFFHPGKEFNSINSLLKPGGYLAVMTEQYESLDSFKTWYYKRDKTHVSFFHRNSFLYLCKTFGYTIHWQDRNRVIVLQKA